MRETRYVVAGVAQADTGQTTIVQAPTWAKHSIWYLSVVATAGTTPLTDFKFHPVIPKVTGAPVVATTQGGGGGNNEVQTITLTGGPTHGTFTITWTGVSANISVTTAAIPATASGAAVQEALRQAMHAQSTYTPGDIVVARTGAGTSGDPYVHTLTYSGASVDNTNVDAVTVSGARLHTLAADTALDFAGWDGITQIAGTTAGVVTVQMGPYLTTDDTGPVYAVNSMLPDLIAAKVTLDRADANETYTYSLYVTFEG